MVVNSFQSLIANYKLPIPYFINGAALGVDGGVIRSII